MYALHLPSVTKRRAQRKSDNRSQNLDGVKYISSPHFLRSWMGRVPRVPQAGCIYAHAILLEKECQYCVSICMSISLSLVSAHISKIRMSILHQIFEAGCPWSWLGLPLVALRYCYAVLPVLWMTSYLSVVGQAKVTLTSRILRVAHQRSPAAKWFSKAVSFGNNSRRISRRVIGCFR